MDWYAIARNDWSIYRDTSRIKKYVQFQKITKEKYEMITGEVYE